MGFGWGGMISQLPPIEAVKLDPQYQSTCMGWGSVSRERMENGARVWSVEFPRLSTSPYFRMFDLDRTIVFTS